MSRIRLAFWVCGVLTLRPETPATVGIEPDTYPPAAVLPPCISAEPEVRDDAGPVPQDLRAERNGLIWVDSSQEWLTEALFRRLVWIDSMFYAHPRAEREDPRSRFRVKIFSLTDLENPSGVEPDVELFASVKLPGLRDRFRIVLDSEELDAFPGRNPEERTNQPQLALRRMGRWLDADVGAKLSQPPRAFTRLTARQVWDRSERQWSASQRGFYDTDEGFGTVATLSQHTWPRPRFMVGHTSSIRWSESTLGLEWQDSVMFAFVPRLIEADRQGQFVGYSDMADCLALRLSVRGHHNGSHEMESYRSSIIYRRQLWNRDYLYLEIVPEIEWEAENGWDPVYSLRTGIDILFWRDL